MSHYMTALAMKQSGLKPAAKIVLYWLADHHNSETGACFPSLKRLADECEMSKATVTRHLANLEADGLIARQHQHRENGSQTSTSYTLNLSPPPVSNCDSPCSELRHPPVSNCAPHNLGRYNLGSESSIARDARGNDDAGGFDEFWARYPRKIGKGAARKAYARAVKKASPDVVFEALGRQLPAMEAKEPAYRPHPATWLNQERWADEPESRPKDATSGQGRTERITKDGKRQVWHPGDGWMTEHA